MERTLRWASICRRVRRVGCRCQGEGGSGSVRQLSVDLSKKVILVGDHSGTALVCQKDKDVGIGPEGVESLMLRRG